MSPRETRPKMIRLQITLTSIQVEFLRELGRRNGLSYSENLRGILERARLELQKEKSQAAV